MDQYGNLVYSICYRITNDYFDAQDLTQETFLSAYRHLDAFDGANPKAWLCRIASNKGLDYFYREMTITEIAEAEQIPSYLDKWSEKLYSVSSEISEGLNRLVSPEERNE